VPEDAELVLGVADALLELPTVGRGLAAVDSFQLGLRVLELLPGPILVDLARGDGVVDKRDRAVLLDLEEAGAGRELADLGIPLQVDAGGTGLERGNQRSVPSEDADLTVLARHDQHLGLAFERRTVRRHERHAERLGQELRGDAGRLGLGVGLGLGPRDVRIFRLLVVQRARKIERFLSQPFHVAEPFTGSPGKYVKLEDTIRSFQEVLDGKHDDLPEQAFYLVGAIEDVVEAAEKMKTTA